MAPLSNVNCVQSTPTWGSFRSSLRPQRHPCVKRTSCLLTQTAKSRSRHQQPSPIRQPTTLTLSTYLWAQTTWTAALFMTAGRDFSILFLETKSNLASNVTGALPTRLTVHQPPFPKHHLVQLHSKKPGSNLIWSGLWPRSGLHWAAAQWPQWSS